LIDGKKIRHKKTKEFFTKAMLCKMMKCRPSELRYEDPEELQLISYFFMKLAEKNPMMMFG